MLVELGDPAAFAGALRQIMTEPALRDLLSAGATSEREDRKSTRLNSSHT